MKMIFTTMVICCCQLMVYAQPAKYEIGFTEKEITIVKDKDEDVLKEITFKVKNADDDAYKDYKLEIEADGTTSTLPGCDYEIGFRKGSLRGLPETNKMYIKVKADSLEDRVRTLVLKIKVTDKSGTVLSNDKNGADEETYTITITVKPYSMPLSQYNYLAYLGTNFDLVDGIKAKNLFFATNVFLPRYRDVGFTVSMYGNRTLTLSDTSANTIFTSGIVGHGDSTVRYRSKATAANSFVSDNLGAHTSMLVPLGFLSEKRNQIQLYYSPSCEFVWRRITSSTTYSNLALYDSSVVHNPIPDYSVMEMPLQRTLNYNIYDIYFGFLGATVVHETDNISVRLQLTLAYSISYAPTTGTFVNLVNTTTYQKSEDLSFAGRVWITEPTTGLTLQAEVFNNSKRPRPYYGVTLSKAFNFKNLASIFQPISTR